MNTNRAGRATLLKGFLALVLLALIAAGCGGSDSEADEAEEAETATEETDSETAEEAEADEEAAEAEEEAPASGDKTEVRWFVGLGTGSQDEQIDAQDAVVEAFNASQDEIVLVAEYIDNTTAKDTLATQIAAGNAPDIIGPVGLEGSNAFAGQYADIEPLVEAAGFDLSPFGSSVDVYRTAEGALEGIPFATFPSAIFYNKDLFDEAGLPYPPAEYGPDGTSVYGEGTEFEGPWDWDKMAEIAALLTVDSAGNDASASGFDPESIEQFGFYHQWTDNPTSMGTSFGAGSLVADDGSAKVPDAWIDGWKWYQGMVHETHAAPTTTQANSEEFNAGNVFASGKVAMASTHLWYTCCIADADGNKLDFWDLGALPTQNGELVSKLHGDTFRIHKDSENPDAAFQVLSYFFSDAALDLLDVYGGMPARPDIRDAYFAKLDTDFPQGVNWDVIIAGLDYSDVPNHQANMPNFLEADARVKELQDPLLEDPAFDLDAAVAELETDLTAIFAG